MGFLLAGFFADRPFDRPPITRFTPADTVARIGANTSDNFLFAIALRFIYDALRMYPNMCMGEHGHDNSMIWLDEPSYRLIRAVHAQADMVRDIVDVLGHAPLPLHLHVNVVTMEVAPMPTGIHYPYVGARFHGRDRHRMAQVRTGHIDARHVLDTFPWWVPIPSMRSFRCHASCIQVEPDVACMAPGAVDDSPGNEPLRSL